MNHKNTETEHSISENQWETIARYDQVLEANVMKSLLISEGILAELADAHTISSFGLISQSLGGVRLQVPTHNAEEARSLLKDVAAGLIQLEDIESDDAPPIIEPAPEFLPPLWHPDWAALMGIFFGPLFPIFLHYQNWQLLNKQAEKQLTLRWLIATLLITLGIPSYILWAEGSFQSGSVILSLVWGFILLIWYFSQGRTLASLMVNWTYPKKPWGLAMLVGAISVLCFFSALHYVSAQPFLLPTRIATLAKKLPVPFDLDEVTRRIAVNVDDLTITLIMETSLNRLDEEQIEELHAKTKESTCNDLRINPMIAQGMILKIMYVDLSQQTLASFQVDNNDCMALHF